MKSSIVYFVVPMALFAAWIGYLGWLVANRPFQAPGYPLVVSRPQILVSELDIIGKLGDPEDGVVKVEVVEVLYAKDDKGPKAGDTIEVSGLKSCRPVVKRGDHELRDDWHAAGEYLIPLRPQDKGKAAYAVAALPPSPGFGFLGNVVRRIYPANAEVRAQYDQAPKP